MSLTRLVFSELPAQCRCIPAKLRSVVQAEFGLSFAEHVRTF